MAEATKKQTGVRLSPDLLRKLGHLAVDQDKSLSQLLEQIVLEWWEAHPEHIETYGTIDRTPPKKPGPKPKSEG